MAHLFDLVWVFALGAATGPLGFLLREALIRRAPKRCTWCDKKQSKGFRGGACDSCLPGVEAAAPEDWPRA